VGFDGIEVMVTRSGETQSSDRLAELTDLYGISVRSIHAPFLMAAKNVWGKPLTKIKRSVEMATALRADVIVVHLPYFWQWGYASWASSNLNSYATRSGVTIAVENAMLVNVFKPLNLSLYNSVREMQQFDSLVFDTSHFAIARLDLFEVWDALKAKVKHIHLSNNFLRGFDDHALPFDGRLPLDRFLAVLNRDGFEGKIVLELGPGPLEARLGEDRIVENLTRSLEFCKRCYMNPVG
jgi:sugar phosphate isomerase/epimerase